MSNFRFGCSVHKGKLNERDAKTIEFKITCLCKYRKQT